MHPSSYIEKPFKEELPIENVDFSYLYSKVEVEKHK